VKLETLRVDKQIHDDNERITTADGVNKVGNLLWFERTPRVEQLLTRIVFVGNLDEADIIDFRESRVNQPKL
jgi:hypothetical protein